MIWYKCFAITMVIQRFCYRPAFHNQLNFTQVMIIFCHPILVRQWNDENCSVFHSVGKFILRIARTNFSALFQSSIERAKDTEKSKSMLSPFFSLCTQSFCILVIHFFSPLLSLLPSVVLIEICGFVVAPLKTYQEKIMIPIPPPPKKKVAIASHVHKF